jgi:hypothetical protein
MIGTWDGLQVLMRVGKNIIKEGEKREVEKNG